PDATLHRLPIPGRSLPLLQKLGIGADTLLGGCDLFLWTDYVYPPVRKAKKAMILHDLAFLKDPAWHGSQSSALAESARRAASLSDLVLVPSPQVARDARTLLPEIQEKIRLLPWGGDHAPGFDLDRPLPENLLPPGEGPLFLCVGRIEPRKNHALLLEAFSLLRKKLPRARLVVAGPPGWETREVQNRLHKLHQDPSSGIRWAKDLPDALLFPLLARAAALVYPSLYEGFGLPVAEALHLGIPPIVTEETAPAWVAGPAGLAVPPGDAQALSRAMETLATDKKKRMALSASALSRSKEFTWQKTARRLAALLQQNT
ncbi:MAG TPA: glycosyltransferase family 1 protein, partial [Planctomycetes bacterium]|nr:glycosyltransferase family 1 protein [Planctomycetota bacterium]